MPDGIGAMTAMSVTAALVVVALTTAAGTLLVGSTRADRPLGETLGWCWAAGTLLLTSAYAVLIAIHARPGPKKLGLVLSIAAIAGFVRRRPARMPRRAPLDPVVVALAAVAAAGCAVFALQSVAEPLWSTDFLAIWGFKAKTIYFTGAVPDRLFHDPATYWSHPEYPLFVPLLTAAFSAAAGGWNDETMGLLWAAWQIATVLVIAGFCRRRGSARVAAAAAALIAWFHPLYRVFNAGLADVPFAFAAVLLCAAAAERSVWGAVLAALVAVSTKQEGTLLAILVAAALLVGYREDRRVRRATAAAIAVVTATHFLLLRALRGPVSYRDFTLVPLAHAADLAARFGRLMGAVAGSLTLPLLVVVAAAAAIFVVGRRSRNDLLLAALALQVGAYLAACLLSAFDPAWQFGSAFFRTASALVPAAALILASRIDPATSVPRPATD